jgi:5'-nucleotidase
MRILITNDDGMMAPALVPLIRLCRKYGDVTAFVPKYEQSGKSHSIEIHKAFEAKEVQLADDVTVWAVDSSPADCVRLAVLGMKKEFDLVISGINRGFNIGVDIQYSGTAGAALEAATLGINALAISTSPEYYPDAIEHFDKIFSFLIDNNFYNHNSIYNVNIPKDPKEIRITYQGSAYYSDEFEYLGDNMYMPCGVCVHKDTGNLTLDTDAVINGYISITPISTSRTNMDVYKKLTDI